MSKGKDSNMSAPRLSFNVDLSMNPYASEISRRLEQSTDVDDESYACARNIRSDSTRPVGPSDPPRETMAELSSLKCSTNGSEETTSSTTTPNAETTPVALSFGPLLFGHINEIRENEPLFVPEYPQVPQTPQTPNTKSTNTNSTFSTGKRIRLTASGKIHAAARPITADLDEADRCIWRMKNDGNSNSEIAVELKKLGIHYDPKTVGTRHLRIKAAVARNGEMINGRQWNELEDELLLEIYQKAFDATIEAIARVKTRLFHIVASNLSKQSEASVPFTKDACERRYRFLTGFNPMQQEQPLLDPFASNDGFDKAARNMKLLKEAEEMDREAKEAEIIAQAEQQKILAAMDAKRKAEEEVAKAKAVLKAVGEQAKLKSATAAKKRAAAQGLSLKVSSKVKEMSPPNPATETSAEIFTYTNNILDSVEPVSPSPPPRKDRPKNLGVNQNDHRYRLTVNELEALCRERGLSKKGSKADIMNRLRDYDNSLSDTDLGRILMQNNMSPDGDKANLVERMAFLDATKSAWGYRISQVTDDDLSPHTPAQLAISPHPIGVTAQEPPSNVVKRSFDDSQLHEQSLSKRPRAEQYGQDSLNTSIEGHFQI